MKAQMRTGMRILQAPAARKVTGEQALAAADRALAEAERRDLERFEPPAAYIRAAQREKQSEVGDEPPLPYGRIEGAAGYRPWDHAPKPEPVSEDDLAAYEPPDTYGFRAAQAKRRAAGGAR